MERAFLFGTTPHGFRAAYGNLFPNAVPHPHNMFIGFFAEYGIIGGIAFLMVLVVTLLNIINLFIINDKNDSFNRIFST